MAKSTVRKKENGKKGKKETPVAVRFDDFVNYGEVAAILTNKVEKLCISSKELAHVVMEDTFDYDAFKSTLEEMIDVEMINELMGSELGQGILVGVYLMRSAEVRDAQETEEI